MRAASTRASYPRPPVATPTPSSPSDPCLSPPSPWTGATPQVSNTCSVQLLFSGCMLLIVTQLCHTTLFLLAFPVIARFCLCAWCAFVLCQGCPSARKSFSLSLSLSRLSLFVFCFSPLAIYHRFLSFPASIGVGFLSLSRPYVFSSWPSAPLLSRPIWLSILPHLSSPLHLPAPRTGHLRPR